VVGRPLLLYQRRIFFLGIAKAFWNHQHCWWFSSYKKESPLFQVTILCFIICPIIQTAQLKYSKFFLTTESSLDDSVGHLHVVHKDEHIKDKLPDICLHLRNAAASEFTTGGEDANREKR
jgi:hypothetical protein